MEKDIRLVHPESHCEITDFLVPMTEADGTIICNSENEPILYAPVEAQLYVFRCVYKDGRIVAEHINRDDGVIEFKVSVFKGSSADEQPLAVAHAETIRSDNVYTPFESTETKAISRALLFAGFGIEAKLLAKLQEKTVKTPPKSIKQDLPEKKMIVSEEEDSKRAMASHLDILDSPAESVDQMEVLDLDDPFAANGILPKAEIAKRAEKDKTGRQKQSDKKNKKQKVKENETDQQKEEHASVELEPDAKETEEKEGIAENDLQNNGSEAALDEAKDEGEENCKKEQEINAPGEYVLLEEDINQAAELEVYLGKKVKEIDSTNLSIIKKYMEGEVSERLYSAVASYLG